MEKELLFSLTLLKVSGHQGSITTTNVKRAVKALQQLKAFMIERIAIINVYHDGCERIPIKKHGLRRIYFAKALNYQEALIKAKADKRIVIPEDFLYDRKRYQGKCFIYSAKHKIIQCEEDDNGSVLILDEQVIENILKGPIIYNQFHLDLLADEEKQRMDTFLLFDAKEFALGNGRVTFYGEEDRGFHTIITEFKNNLIDYSFVKVCAVNYRPDGSVKYSPENDLYIFRDDCRLSAEKALERSSNKKLIRELIKNGQKDFIFDKKYDDIFPAPANSFFVSVTTIFNKWDF